VFALGHDALDLRGRLTAALLYAGPGAMLSHQTAAYWWQLLPTQPSLSHVATPRNRASARGVRVHRQRDLPRIRHRGLPVTTVERTLLDLAAVLPFPALRRALAEADFRGRLDPGALRRELGRGRPGAAALRKALALHCPELARTRSVLEREFLALCERARLALPEVNEQVEGLMVDALWRQARVIAELDGLAAHSSPAQLARDHDRDLRLRRAGYAVLRYSWRQVIADPAAVAADLRRVLSS
jgi:very-short-patch-repair endonuclease